MRWLLRILLFVCGLLGFVFTQGLDKAYAETPRASSKSKESNDKITGWHLRLALAGSYNNLGLQFGGEGGYRWRLYDHDSLALKDNFLKLGVTAVVTPATIAGGPVLRIKPASFFFFSVAYIYRLYLPAFMGGTVFKDMEDVRSHFQGTTYFYDGQQRLDARVNDVIARNNGRLLFGAHLLRFGATLQLRFKGVLALVNARMYLLWAPFEDVDNSQVYYEATYDVMVKKEDQIFDMIAGLGYQWRNFRFLGTVSYTLAVQSQEVRLGIGPAFQWVFLKKWRSVYQPSLLVIARWWAQHRFRVGPMPNIAFILESQFR